MILQREIAGDEPLQRVAVRLAQYEWARATNAPAKLCRGFDEGRRELNQWKITVDLYGGFLSAHRGEQGSRRQPQIPIA
jgi:hypothetical protein